MRLALAVSGGGDSIALFELARAFGAERGAIDWIVFTVDHGLQKGSRALAEAVAARAQAAGARCEILTWAGEKPTTGLQAAARAARHERLSDAAVRWGADAVLLGHTLDDHVETVMQRDEHGGAGQDGLAGLAPASLVHGVVFARPLLGLRRAAVRAWLAGQAVPWFDDPANDDLRFGRTQVRRALAHDPGLWEALRRRSVEAGARRAGAGQAAAAFARAHVRLDPLGYATIERPAFDALDPEIAARVLAAVSAAVKSGDYGLALGGARKALAALSHPGTQASASRAFTVAGVRIARRAGRLEVVREPRALPQRTPLRGGEDGALWDGRFALSIAPNAKSDVELGPLGADVDQAASDQAGAPLLARQGQPAVFLGASLIGLPAGALWLDPRFVDVVRARFLGAAAWTITPSWEWALRDALSPPCDPAPDGGFA